MRKIKQLLTTIAVLLCSLAVSAHDFEVDGIYYNIVSSTTLTVEVTYRGNDCGDYPNEYTRAVTIPEAVTYNSNSYRVTSIASNAFWDCSSLTSITIPESVTSINSCAFELCRSLASITIPESVTSIAYSAFGGCDSLVSIDIKDGNIVYDSRNNCNAIIETSSNTLIIGCGTTTIPESVTTIGDYAFRLCVGLTSITIPSSVTSIGNNAFVGCNNLTSVVISDGLIRIGSIAFSGCSSLTSITIPEGVTWIGSTAFSGCSSLTSITIPESVTEIGYSAFSGCSSLTSITIPEGVTWIESYAFEGCSSLTSITIPKSVTEIEEFAFYNCVKLNKVLNFSNLKFIRGSEGYGYIAYYAQKVTNVDGIIDDYYYAVEDGVSYLIGYCGTDKELILPEDYKGNDYLIDSDAFYDNDNIISAVIPSTVNKIGYRAFAECNNLASVDIARGVLEIGKNAFENCIGLNSIVIPRNLLDIGDRAFAGCNALASLEFKEGVETIGNNAFENCTSLQTIIFPESLVTIGGNAFKGCTGVTALFFSANIETFGYNAFEGCEAVETLTVTGSVMPTIPSSKLTSIMLFSPHPLETEEFANKVYRNATLYVPIGSLERYQSADVWKKFWNIQEFDATGIEEIGANKVAIEVTANGISLSNAEGKTVAVYTGNGALVKKTDSYTGEVFTLYKGIYIICIEDRILKVKL